MATASLVQCIGQMPDPVLRYRCARCGRVATITSSEFALLPHMTAEEIAAPSCDMPWTNPKDVPMPEPKLPLPDELPPPPAPKPKRLRRR